MFRDRVCVLTALLLLSIVRPCSADDLGTEAAQLRRWVDFKSRALDIELQLLGLDQLNTDDAKVRGDALHKLAQRDVDVAEANLRKKTARRQNISKGSVAMTAVLGALAGLFKPVDTVKAFGVAGATVGTVTPFVSGALAGQDTTNAFAVKMRAAMTEWVKAREKLTGRKLTEAFIKFYEAKDKTCGEHPGFCINLNQFEFPPPKEKLTTMAEQSQLYTPAKDSP